MGNEINPYLIDKMIHLGASYIYDMNTVIKERHYYPFLNLVYNSTRCVLIILGTHY